MVTLCRVNGLGLIFIALMWGLACSSSSTPTTVPTETPVAPPGSTDTAVPTPTPVPSARQVIENSSVKMLALNTASFTLEHEDEGSSELFPGVELQLVEGQVNIPDRFKVRAEAVSTFPPRSFFKIDVVVVEDQAVMTDFIIRGKWNPIPTENLPFNFADLGRTLSGIILSLEAPAFNGTEVVDGEQTRRIKGVVPSEALKPLVPASGLDYEVGLELWIDQTNSLLRKARIEGQLLSTDQTDVVRVLTIYDFDEPVEISLP